MVGKYKSVAACIVHWGGRGAACSSQLTSYVQYKISHHVIYPVGWIGHCSIRSQRNVIALSKYHLGQPFRHTECVGYSTSCRCLCYMMSEGFYQELCT